MVAIVSGNNLGLNLGSLSALGTRGLFGTPTQGRSGERAYVNVSTGNLVLQDLDTILAGLGPDATALRTYNSRGRYDGDNGDQWQGNAKRIEELGLTIRRYDSDGSCCEYAWDCDRRLYVATVGAGSAVDTIARNPDLTFTWTDGATGAQETYQCGIAGGRILSARDASGNALAYAYDCGGRLVKVTDADGEAVEFVYGGRCGNDLLQVRTSLASGQVVKLVSYEYDDHDRLSSVGVNLDPEHLLPAGSETASRYVTRYGYECDSNRVATITESDGTSLSFEYVCCGPCDWRVASVTDGAGQVTRFCYDLDERRTTVTDPYRTSTVYGYDQRGQLTEIRSGVTARNPSGLQRVSFGYDRLGNVAVVTDGLGNTVVMQYDAAGNLLRQVDQAGNTLARTYDVRNQVLTETIYGVPAGKGGAAAQPQTTRYVYDAAGKNLLRFVVSPDGRVTEYRYDARGQRTAAIDYAAKAFPVAVLGEAEVPSEGAMASWAAAQDLARTERTDTEYDFRGLVKTVTTYGELDAAGQGKPETASATHYVYDQHGRLLQTVTPDGKGVTQSIYDGLGRVVSTVSRAVTGSPSTTTVTQYDDANGKTVVTLGNGLVTTSAIDGAGRLVSVVQSSATAGELGTTRYVYDADGRLLMTEDPTGVRAWMLYDAAGRKVADVDAAGTLTEYVYDANGRRTETIRYHTPIDVSRLVDAYGNPTTTYNPNPAAAGCVYEKVTLEDLRPVAAARDARAWNLYDAAGRLVWQVDALGYATRTEYDGASRVTKVTRFATPIDPRALGDGNAVALAVGGFATGLKLVEEVQGSGPNAPRRLTATVWSVTGVHDARGLNGTVTFFAGDVVLGAAQVVNGVATLTVSNLPPGTSSIHAEYSGDGDDLGSVTDQLVETAVAAPPTTVIVTASGPAQAGASTQLVATVTGQPGQHPTGTVLFFDDGLPIGAAELVDGVATLQVNDLPVGKNKISATYAGDANNAGSSSQAVGQCVVRSATSVAESVTTLRASNAQTEPGAPVTLAALVTGANPTGKVSFYDGLLLLGTAEVVNGVASLTTTGLPLGSASITARYSGDGANAPSASAPTSELVLNPSATSLVATLGPNQTVALAATVFGGPVPAPWSSGTVSFFNGDVLLGSATVQGGTARLTVTGFTLADGGLRAVYSGFANGAGSTSAVVTTLLPGIALPSTLPAAKLSLASAGPVARDAAISVRVAGASPTGTVSFFSGRTLLGTAAVVNGVATLTGADLPVGAVTLAATYSGDAKNAGAVLTFAQTVTAAATTTRLTVAPGAYASQNAPVLLTAEVKGSDPGGTVTFYCGGAALGTAALVNGLAGLTVKDLPAGLDAITAVYAGDAHNAASASAAVNENVVAAPVYVTLTASTPSIAQGEALTLVAHVTGNRPTGQVSFVSGTKVLGSADLVAGVATLTIDAVNLPAGRDAIVAVYAGDEHNASTASAAQCEAVARGVVTTVVTQDPADRAVITLYDRDGRARGVIDGEGYLTETRYDAAGRPVETIAYATRVDGFTDAASIAGRVALARARGTLEGLAPAADAAHDVHTFTYYDARGQVVAQVDGERYLTEYTYWQNGQLDRTVRHANPVPAGVAVTAGTAVQVLRDAAGSSPQDQVAESTWDELGRLARKTNAEGTVTSYAYDAVGNRIRSTVALDTEDQRTLLVRHDVQGRVVAELSAEGAKLLTPGDTAEQIEAIWRGYAKTYAYDAAGRRTSETDALGHRTVFFYDDAGRLRFTVNAAGEVSERTYDALGRLVSEARFGNRLPDAVLGTLAGGLLSSGGSAAAAAALEGARGARPGEPETAPSTTSYEYDADGRMVKATDAEGGVTRTAYDAFGDAVRTTQDLTKGGAEVRVDTASFDRRGLVRDTVADAGQGHVNATTHTDHDAFGRVTDTWINGRQTHQDFDRLGRVVQVVDPLSNGRWTTYDAFGRVHTQTDANHGTTTYTYDDRERSVTMDMPEGVSVKTVHNREGQTFTVRDGNGVTTTYRYDANGNLHTTEVLRRDGTTAITSESAYDAAGRLIDALDGNRARTHYDYDAASRIFTRTVDADGLKLQTRYQYDAKAQLIRETDPNGVVTETHYDLKGEVLRRIVDAVPVGDDGLPVPSEVGKHLALETTFTYDARGQQLTVESPSGKVTRHDYDALGRRKQTTVDPGGLNLVTTYDYDANGNVVRSAVDLGDGRQQVTRYGYDADGRLRVTVDGEGGVSTIDYDANGNVVERRSYLRTPAALASWVSGTVLEIGVADLDAHDLRTRTVYDGLNRARYTVDGTGAVVEQNHDRNGNVVERIAYAVRIPTSTEMTREKVAAALAAAVAEAQASGPRSSQDLHLTREYDELNRITWSVDGLGSVTQQIYDRNGNLVKQIAYAARGSLAAKPAGSAHDRVTLRAYDAANRLRYTVDALGDVAEQVYDADGNLVQSIAHAARVAAPTHDSPLPSEGDLREALRTAGGDSEARVARAVYDGAGRLRFGVDAAGAVTENVYDRAGNVVQTTAYARIIDASALDAKARPEDVARLLAAGRAPAAAVTIGHGTDGLREPDAIQASEGDRTTLSVYDAASRLRYAVDAGGVLTERAYDGAGRVTEKIVYARPIDASQTAALVAGTWRPTVDAARDQWESSGYDRVGRLTSTTDATRTQGEAYAYNALGEKTSYQNAAGKVWKYDYDAAGRPEREEGPPVDVATVAPGPDGKLVVGQPLRAPIVTVSAYDGLGNILSRTEAKDLPGERTTSWRYDAAGRQVETIFPEVVVYDGEALGDLLSRGPEAGAGAPRTLSTHTWYDAFGDAVACTDVAGHTSYKAYDAAGRVKYEVDALGYVTGYGRDAFGDARTLTRYGGRTDLGNTLGPDGAPIAPTAGDVEAALARVPAGHDADRTVETRYDGQGRAVEVRQPQALVFGGQGEAYVAQGLVKSTYDAFGQVVRSDSLVDPRAAAPADQWATTLHYYDQRGREAATVDAMGFLTTRRYDAFGNLVRQTEYANPTSGATTASFALPAGQDPALGGDRTVVSGYDALNRKTSDARLHVDVGMTDQGERAFGDVLTEYGYDAVGNLTRTAQHLGTGGEVYVTYTVYDALGRTTAVVAPDRTSTIDGAHLLPLVTFQRDAYGNVVVKREYAGTARQDPDTGKWSAQADDEHDRVTLTAYDKRGKAVQVEDAERHEHYLAYDAAGNLAKQAQAVTVDGVRQILFTVFRYDALGRQIAALTPGSSSRVVGADFATRHVELGQQATTAVTTAVRYDAFGEVVERGTFETLADGEDPQARLAALSRGDKHGSYKEFFDYDAAGHLWRTNSGDGNVKVMLYDLLGRQTATVTSAGSAETGGDGVDLRTYGSAQEVAALDGDPNHLLRRTDSVLDKLGRVVTQRLPWRRDRWATALGAGDDPGSLAAGGRPEVHQEFDRWGNVITQTDVRNAEWVTRFRYGADDQVVEKSDPAFLSIDAHGNAREVSPRTSLFYDGLGRQIAVRDARGNVNRQTWDAAGQLVAEIHADATADGKGTVVNAYDAFGDKVQVTDAERRVTTYEYDRLGENTAITSAEVEVAHVSFGNDGGHALSVDPAVRRRIRTENHYDEAGRKISTTNGAGETTRYAYDLRNNVVKTATPVATTLAAFNVYGRQIASEDGNGNQVTNTHGNVTTWSYDAFGLLVDHRDFTIPQDGDPLEVQLANGEVKYTFEYDNARQLKRQGNDRPGEAQQQDLQYEYDAAGQMVAIRDRSNPSAEKVTRYSYNAAGKHVLEQTTQGGTTYQDQVLAYDALGRLVLVSALDGVQVRFDYDEAGNRLRATSRQGWNEPEKALWFAYDEMNRVVLSDGAASGDVADDANLTEEQGHRLTYDKNGNRKTDTYKGTWVLDEPIPQGHYETVDDGNGGTTEQWVPEDPIYTDQRLVTEHYDYDALNRLTNTAFGEKGKAATVTLENRHYDGASRVVIAGPEGAVSKDYVKHLVGEGGGRSASTSYTQYDAGGRIEFQRAVRTNGSTEYEIDYRNVEHRWTAHEKVQATDAGGAPLFDADHNPIWAQGRDGTGAVAPDANGNAFVVCTTDGGAPKLDEAGRELWVQQRDGTGLPLYASVYDDSSGGYVMVPVTDGNGDPVFDGTGALQFDAQGKPVMVLLRQGGDPKTDINGNPYYVQRTDGTGLLVFDEAGNALPATRTVQATVAGGYDGAGNVKAYRKFQGKDPDDSNTGDLSTYYHFSQIEYDGYREAKVSGYRSDNQNDPGVTSERYDANGFLVKVEDRSKGANNRTFVNDATGHVLYKEQQGHALRQLVVEGNVIAVYGSGTDPKKPADDQGNPRYVDQANFDLNYQPMSNSYPATTAGQYQVKGGDTLKGIALASYGDASLWYLIADANGLGGDQDLRIGQTLVVPTRVGGAHNTADTFKPYDPSKIVGDTSPNLPAPAQHGGGGCGALGIILTVIIVAVAVAVTVITAGATSAALAGLGPVASALIGGAVGGAAGSLASQAVANLVGMQSGFDWGQVALGAIGGAVGAGAGLAFKAVGDLANPLANWAMAGAKSAISNAATQGIGVLTGLQDHFDWRTVATSAVGAAVGAAATQGMNGALNYHPETEGFDFGKNLVSSTASNFASSVAVQVVRGGRIDVANLAADAFGNALGSSIGTQYEVSKAEAKARAEAEKALLAAQQAQANAGGSGGGVGGGPLGTLAAMLQQTTLGGLPGEAGPAAEAAPAEPSTYTVGKEGARGFWGVAQSMLPAGASNAEIQRLAQELMTANPGVTTLHVGDELNLSDGSVSSEALRTYGAMDQKYQAQLAAAAQARAQQEAAAAAQATADQPTGSPAAGATGDGPTEGAAGKSRTYIAGFGEVPSYTGEFPSPWPPIMNYTPARTGEHPDGWYPPSEIRGWLRDAAEYNDVPLELAAAILQQENPKNAPSWRKFAQFGERTLTTMAAELDEVAFDLVPDKISGGSSGFANMSRSTLRRGAAYVENVLGYKAIPDEVASRRDGRVTVDAQIPGGDWRNDLYFMTAHVRQLIDVTTGTTGYSGPLTREQVESVAAAYNGRGPLAVKYGQDAVARIDRAAAGGVPLYFYEK